MQLYQLEQFCAIARCEHVSKAAAELHISQPTLSLNLARLEDELGVHLFDRVGRNIKLNLYGQEFYSHVEKALQELDNAKQKMQDISSAVGTPTVFADALFNDTFAVLQDYLIARPDTKVIHLILTIPEILERLRNGKLDFGIIMKPSGCEIEEGFDWQPLWQTELLALVRDTHPLAKRECIRLNELKDQEFICAIDGFDSRNAFDYYCGQAGFTPNYRYTSIKPYLFNDLTRQYGCISIMSKIMWDCHGVDRENLSGLRTDMAHITALPLVEPACSVGFGIITYKANYMSRSAKILMDYVARYFMDNPGLF